MNNLDKLKIPEFELKAPKRISPSQYTAMKQCAYREVLKKSLGKPLLAPAPAAFLGSIIHKMLELIAKGAIPDKVEFLKMWKDLVMEKEKELKENGLSEYLPLKRSVPNFALKKHQTLKHLLQSSTSSKSFSNEKTKCHSEKWFQSKDGKIGGYLDLILERETISLIDFKTGEVFEDKDSQKIKPAYKTQLKLYAWLYFETNGNYPDELWLADLNRHWHSISFTPKECEELATEAKEMLHDVTRKVKENQRAALASPKSETCRYCLYRPACQYYWQATAHENSWTLDLKGRLKAVKKFQTGNFNLEIENESGNYYIVNFNQLDFDLLKSLQNQEVQVFNLCKTNQDGVYSTLKSTKIYA